MECEHKIEWIREREDGDVYCTVCRTIFDSSAKLVEEWNREIIEGLGQRRGTPTG